ncbi:MAG: DoxX family protein [Proteobacteria bacterium]|nr:DoxX family protein [Pseudomonadota bacterium]
MMNTFHNNMATLIGRALIALLFIPAGVAKLSGFEGTVGYISSVGMPFATLAAVLAIMIELGAGSALLVGFCTRIAAVVLAIFTLVASFYFHPYWAVAADQAFVTQLLFFKNIAVVGGLLVVAAFGAGGWSFDARNVHAK